MKVKIYIGNDFEKLDLFDDENISLTAKLNDIEKLSNVFTDFSDSFTVPASKNNNELFKHYYDFDIDNTFNANIRVPAYIEIDTIPFRYGTIQLEAVKLKNHLPDNYKITFYGNITQLTTLFGDDVINDLDYDVTAGVKTKVRSDISQYDFEYNGPNIINGINLPTFKNGDIIIPLISYGNRDWEYDQGVASVDISKNAGAITDKELRPSLRIIRIIEAIENKYGITFSRGFLSKAIFQDLFIWMNNNPENELASGKVNWTSGNQEYLNLATDVFTYTLNGPQLTFEFRYKITPGSSDMNKDYEVYFVRDGVILGRQSFKGVADRTVGVRGLFNQPYPQTQSIELWVASREPIDFFAETWHRIYQVSGGSQGTRPVRYASGSNSLIPDFRAETALPKLKVIDFITGLMKMFKLIIRPITPNSFYLDTIDAFYSSGSFLDLTRYTNQEEVEVERPDIYSSIKFKYQKTDNVLGKRFREVNNPITEIGYGDLFAEYQNIESKSELNVELPFENMLFERLTKPNNDLTNIVIGQSQTLNGSELSPNKSKPILFYNNGISNLTATPIKFSYSGQSPFELAYVYLVGNTNNEILSQVTNSINFGAEVDPWHQFEIGNSLYLNFWSNWINTIYDTKQRKLNFKANIPSRFIDEISLNDRIIIGDKRYKINDYKINLSNADVELNLFKDIYTPLDPVLLTPTTITGDVSFITDWTSINSSSVFLYGPQTNRITMINLDGSLNTSFNAGTGFNTNNFLYTSILYDNQLNKLLFTGSFTTYNSVAANRIIRLNLDGTIDTSFVYGTGFNNYTTFSLIQGDKYIIGGRFSSYNGETGINRLIRLNKNGTRDTTFNIGTGFTSGGEATIDAKLGPNNEIYVSTYATLYNGVAIPRLVKLSADGVLDTTFNTNIGTGPNTGNLPNGLLLNENGLYFFGYFTQFNGNTRGRFVKLDAETGLDALDADFEFWRGTGFSADVFEGRFIYNDRILFRGLSTGLQYNGFTSSNNLIVDPDGSLFMTIPSGYSYTYNIGDYLYGVTTDGSIELIIDPVLESIDYTSFITNAGVKHFDISLRTVGAWTIDIHDYGYGTSWITPLVVEGNGSSTITFRVEEKASQLTPEVYLPRYGGFIINLANGCKRYITIKQNGL
jgi:hypothetical protein